MTKNKGPSRERRKQNRKGKPPPEPVTRKFPDYDKGLNRVRLFARDREANQVYGYVNINGLEYSLNGYYKGDSDTTGFPWWGGTLNLKH